MHAKAHGVLEGTLTIDAGLSPELAQGLFAAPGEHNVSILISANAGNILPDAISLPHGLVLKMPEAKANACPIAEAQGICRAMTGCKPR